MTAMRASIAWLCSLMVASAGAAAQPTEFIDGRLARIDDPLRVQFNDTARAPDPDKFRQTASIAAQTLGWTVLGAKDDRVELARTVSGKHKMHVELLYSERGYVLRYLDSENLLYREDAQTRGGGHARAIHKNYNLWVRELARGINSALGLSAVATVSPRGAKSARAATGDGAAPSVQHTPLPDNINIATPGPDAPASAARFSGIWVGRWDGKFDQTLVVEKFEGNIVRFVYALNPAQMSDPAGRSWSRKRGALDEDGVLRASWDTRRGPVQVSYRLSADGTHLLGERIRGGRIATATLERTAPPEAAR